jgi:cellobiose-specific phosphotransferase system component IIA
MKEKIANCKTLLRDLASDHLEYTCRASEAAIQGDEEEARECQNVAESSLNSMLTVQRRIIRLEAAENNRRLRLVK